jgi:hypothetical protein
MADKEGLLCLYPSSSISLLHKHLKLNINKYGLNTHFLNRATPNKTILLNTPILLNSFNSIF